MFIHSNTHHVGAIARLVCSDSESFIAAVYHINPIEPYVRFVSFTQNGTKRGGNMKVELRWRSLKLHFTQWISPLLAAWVTSKGNISSPLLKQRKSYVTWFLSRLCRASSPLCLSAVGWQRAPAVWWVLGKDFLCVSHTSIHQHIQLPSPGVRFICCLEEGLQRCEEPVSCLWQSHEKCMFFFYCALGVVIKPSSKGTKTTSSL